MSKKQEPTEPELDPNDPAVLAFIEAEAERAAAPYVGLFPDDVVAAFRERTALFLATHPDMVRMVRVAMQAGAPATSTPATGAPTAGTPARALAGNAPPATAGRGASAPGDVTRTPAKKRAGRR